MLNMMNPGYGMPMAAPSLFAPQQNTFGAMLMMMNTLMRMMMSLMTGMVGGEHPMSQGGVNFGAGAPGGFGGGSPLGGFLGGGGGYAGGGGGGSAAIPFNSSLGSAGPVGSKTQAFIDAAKSKQGTPYVFGAAGPNAFDCSGLVSWALKQAGSNAPRLTAEGYRQRYKGTAVGRDQLKPGDLVFFHSSNSRGIGPGKATHVEIYLGNGMTMGTDSPKEGARIEPINWSTFIGGARAPELQG